mmetsp:Transcript_11161/g.10085  ORF Transcript_11161/g.10085 Transcript_11161/m.10085 type:complete len:92 (+) Transcript_11161:51-326(+)
MSSPEYQQIDKPTSVLSFNRIISIISIILLLGISTLVVVITNKSLNSNSNHVLLNTEEKFNQLNLIETVVIPATSRPTRRPTEPPTESVDV